MRIVSLLPSATEIVYALGLGDDLVGVTDECDYPPDAVTKPVVSRSALPQGRPLTSREIDEAVRQKMDVHEPLYILDKELLRREQPDVILTQDLCRVCAVPSGQVQRALDELGTSEAKVVSLDPHTMDDVIGQIEVVGSMLDRADRAKEITGLLRSRVARVKEIAMRLPTLQVFALDWSDPPFVAGHWIPEMVEAVGGVNLLNAKGEPSKVVTWRQIRDENPEVIVFMSASEASVPRTSPKIAGSGQVPRRIRAPDPGGRARGMFSRNPPPVMWAAACSSPSVASDMTSGA